jgi:hypothetical protein
LIDEHIARDSHILKLNILGCDRTTPLKQNLVPRFARAGGKDESYGKKISSRRRPDNEMGIEKMREFRLGSSLAFSWIEQKALTRDSQGLVIGRGDRTQSFFCFPFFIRGKARWQDG